MPGGPAPLYRDDPRAAEVSDVRVQQQPLTPAGGVANGVPAVAAAPVPAQPAEGGRKDWDDAKLLMMVGGGVVVILAVSALLLMVLVWYLKLVSVLTCRHPTSADLGDLSGIRGRARQNRDRRTGGVEAHRVVNLAALHC